MEECSPHIKYNGFSCIDNKTIGKLFLKLEAQKKGAYVASDITGTAEEVARKQNSKLREDTNCINDFCVAKALKETTEVARFMKPEKEKAWGAKRNWLSNHDIDDVLSSYMILYPTFIHTGSHPIDFQDKTPGIFGGLTCSSDMCDFKKTKAAIDEARKNNTVIKYMSFVFNTHKRTGKGEHWFCAFFEIETMKLYFFDSAGKPERYDCYYMTRFKSLLQESFGDNKKTLTEITNNVQKQPWGSGECGVFCLYFITKMLEMHTVCKHRTNSKELPWYSPKSDSYSRTSMSKSDVFCGLPEDFLMSESCMSDIRRYDDYMVQLRYDFFNVRGKDLRRIAPQEKKRYNECVLPIKRTTPPAKIATNTSPRATHHNRSGNNTSLPAHRR
jgi:hypothetical protein